MPEWLEHQIIEFLTTLFETMGWGGVVGIMALESATLKRRLSSAVVLVVVGRVVSAATPLSSSRRP